MSQRLEMRNVGGMIVESEHVGSVANEANVFRMKRARSVIVLNGANGHSEKSC
jgi:hypothetical protein